MSRFFRNILIPLWLILLFSNSSFAQTADSEKSFSRPDYREWFVSVSGGVQISGYKKVDFVSSNVSPLINVTAGKWFAPELAIRVGYKGLFSIPFQTMKRITIVIFIVMLYLISAS